MENDTQKVANWLANTIWAEESDIGKKILSEQIKDEAFFELIIEAIVKRSYPDSFYTQYTCETGEEVFLNTSVGDPSVSYTVAKHAAEFIRDHLAF